MTNKVDKTLELETLQYLATLGVGYNSDITAILKKYYLIAPKTIEDVGIETRWSIIQNYLENMRNRKLIKYSDNTDEEQKWPAKWTSKVEFKAELTYDGLQYLFYLRNQELTEQMSRSTISTNKRTTFLLWVTVLVSLASLGVSILDYNKTRGNMVEVAVPLSSAPVTK